MVLPRGAGVTPGRKLLDRKVSEVQEWTHGVITDAWSRIRQEVGVKCVMEQG